MEKHALPAVSLAMLLVSALVGMRLGGLVYAQSSQSVTIKADGSIEPSAAPIIRIGDIYTLTGDVNGSLTVERDDCIVNGAGHLVRRLTLNRVDNVKIVYFNVENTESDANETGEGLVIEGTTNSVIAYNNVSKYKTGIQVYGSRNIIAGNNITDNNSHGILIGGEINTLVGNYIVANGNGVYIYISRNNTIMGNQILNNSVGVRILFSMDASYFYILGLPEDLVHHNNFENVQNVVNEGVAIPPLSNIWDDGAAGNYWSDYGGEDADGDGVGDTPYVIDDLNQDNFPLMAPAAIPNAPVELPELPGAPSAALLSPSNATYADASVPLDFVVDKQAAWIGYSLDGQDNVTVAGNVTLAGLSDGVHTITLYANDTFGFTGASETVTFTIAKPEPFPTTLVVAAVVVVVAAVVGIGLLFYFRKRKR